MQCKKNQVLRTVAVLLAVIGLFTGLAVSHEMHRASKMDSTRFHGTWLDAPREVTAFDLMSTDGVFNHARLQNKWTMIFFGFTTCPSVCPTTMAELARMMRLLEKQGVKPLPQVVMVSLDPERDTLKKLHQYVTAFHPQFLGVRSESQERVKAMANEMGVAYTKVGIPGDKDKQHYNIEHTGTVMLFNPEGQLNAFFTMPHHAKLLAKDYQLAISTDQRPHHDT